MTRDAQDQAIIRERAFAIWEAEGRPEGKSEAHWLQAEAEVTANTTTGVIDVAKRLRSTKTRLVVSRRGRAR
jgi:hypothetical protein